jgi:hypothetical protein
VSEANANDARHGASAILFSLTELPHVLVWALPLHAAHIKHFGFVINGANPIKGVRLDRDGLHMTLPGVSIRQGVLSIEPPSWEAAWTRGDASYRGIEALLILQKLRAEFVPPKRTRGQRGVNRGVEATVKRQALDAYMAHVLVENLETGAGVMSAAIDRVADEQPELTKILWPSLHEFNTTPDEIFEPDPPHYIRKFIQREMLKAK